MSNRNNNNDNNNDKKNFPYGRFTIVNEGVQSYPSANYERPPKPGSSSGSKDKK